MPIVVELWDRKGVSVGKVLDFGEIGLENGSQMQTQLSSGVISRDCGVSN